MTDRSGYNEGVNLVWRLTGTGFDKLGLFRLPVPGVGDDQLLVRQEVVTICFSSVKVIQAGEAHPRLRGRRLSKAPVVLGDEAFVIVEEVGRNLQGRFRKGEGYAVVPDLGGRAFGYDIEGGLKRYNVLEGRILDFLLPVEEETIERVGMFALSLSEPLGCVEQSYRLQYRTGLKERGILLVMGAGAAEVERSGLLQQALTKEIAAKRPSKVVVSNLGLALANALQNQADRSAAGFVCIDGAGLSPKATEGRAENGFDDIILLCGGGSEDISRTAREADSALAPGGILNLVGDIPPGTHLRVDIGRTHYDRTLVVGTTGTDFTKAYQANTGSELRAGGVVVFVGAGGPMGQLHLLRAMGLGRWGKIIAVEVEPERLKKLEQWYAGEGAEVTVMDRTSQDIADVLDGRLIDYLVLLSPVAQAIEDYAPHFAPNAVVNAFAGLKGQHISLDAALFCEKHLRVVGHSGLDVESQRLALERIAQGRISVNRVVSGVGGIDAAWDALWATSRSQYAGKIALYPGIEFPLTPIEALTAGEAWSAAHERRLLGRTQ